MTKHFLVCILLSIQSDSHQVDLTGINTQPSRALALALPGQAAETALGQCENLQLALPVALRPQLW